jgi:transcription initiation factor TFIIH subunit 1
MFASKATSAKVSLKVTFKEDIPAGGLLFTFTSPQAGEDRTSVQDLLIPYITANRSAPAGVTAVASTSAAPSPSAAGTPEGLGKGKRKAYDPSTPTSDAGPGTPSAGGGTGGGIKRPQTQNGKIKLRVLRKNPNLKLLYTELVLGKEITEDEFWDGREVSYPVSEHLGVDQSIS